MAAAENKLTFDTISLLAFDICSTITFHGKGEFEKNHVNPEQPALASPLNTIDYVEMHVPGSD